VEGSEEYLGIYVESGSTSGLEELRERIENDELIQERAVEVNLTDSKLKIEESGNPDISVGITGLAGESKVPQRVQDLANEVLGHSNYKCTGDSRRLPRGLTPRVKPTAPNLYYDLV
jgi:hypothetical protein